MMQTPRIKEPHQIPSVRGLLVTGTPRSSCIFSPLIDVPDILSSMFCWGATAGRWKDSKLAGSSLCKNRSIEDKR